MGSRTLAAFGSASVARLRSLLSLVSLRRAMASSLSPPGGHSPEVRRRGTGGSTQLPDGSFACDPARGPSASPLRRLSVLQYRNTLRDLFGSTLDVATVATAEIARLPVDDALFTIMDARLSDQHVRAYYRIADKVAAAATTADANLKAIGGACALDATPTAACVDAFLDKFGARALRRPLSAEEETAYVALNDGSRSTREVFRSLVFVLLQAPAFAYHVEVDGEAIGGDDNTYRLAAYDLASRLSYHFWQTMPDDELFAAAANGSLLTDEGYAAQVNRMFGDQRTRDAINVFYKEWWHVGWLNAFPNTPALQTLAQGTTLFDPGADHLQAMTDEIRAHDRALHVRHGRRVQGPSASPICPSRARRTSRRSTACSPGTATSDYPSHARRRARRHPHARLVSRERQPHDAPRSIAV